MNTGVLGKIFRDGDIIIRENDTGNCMYVIQQGKVEVIQNQNNKEIRLAVLEEGDFFGEMAIFENEVRSATVRALGDVTLLTVDKKNFMRRIHEDPSLAYHIVKTLSNRIRKMDIKHTRITSGDRRNWETRPDQI